MVTNLSLSLCRAAAQFNNAHSVDAPIASVFHVVHPLAARH
jgi:hypothetical protein